MITNITCILSTLRHSHIYRCKYILIYIIGICRYLIRVWYGNIIYNHIVFISEEVLYTY